MLIGVMLAWLLAGMVMGLGPAFDGGPTVPTLLVFYLPLAGGPLLIYGVQRWLGGATFAARRGIAGAAFCFGLWLVCIVVSLNF